MHGDGEGERSTARRYEDGEPGLLMMGGGGGGAGAACCAFLGGEMISSDGVLRAGTIARMTPAGAVDLQTSAGDGSAMVFDLTFLAGELLAE